MTQRLLPIRRVTVYVDGALIERSGAIPSGSVEIGGLPLRLDTETLRTVRLL